MDFESACANVAKVPLGVILQIVGHTQPQGFLAAEQIVFIDDSSYGPSLANTGTIADQKTATMIIWQEVSMLQMRNNFFK